MNWGKNGNPKFKKEQGNPSGSVRSNDLSHAQRIGSETLREYNLPTSPRHLDQVKRYAELMGNHKKYGIKSLYDNKLKPINQSLRVAKIYFAGNLCSSNNRMHALFTGLAS
jgi:hypothetical protein